MWVFGRPRPDPTIGAVDNDKGVPLMNGIVLGINMYIYILYIHWSYQGLSPTMVFGNEQKSSSWPLLGDWNEMFAFLSIFISQNSMERWSFLYTSRYPGTHRHWQIEGQRSKTVKCAMPI